MDLILIGCLGAFGVLVVAVIGFVVMLYNSLIKLKNLVDEAWSGIDVQLKKRYDLIPNLVETIKGYAKHEKGIFENVAELRSRAMGAKGPEQQAKVEGELTSTLKTLFAVAENYPELKADQNFLNLQNTLQEIEGEIERARRYYNGTVREYNIRIEQFPANLVAGMLKFTKREYFEVENEEERKNVKVSFDEENKSEKE
ncbi:MAG TPA: LemA family protein [Candidatus Dojkabacteria bacterium]|jgi:LemA protein